MMNYFYLIPILLFSACTANQENGQTPITEHTVENTSLIISAETHDEIAQPSYIHSTDDGFLLYDYGSQKVYHFDEDGNNTLAFGSEGDGPEEFRYVAELWSFDDLYVLYDRNGSKHIHFQKDGSFLKEVPLESETFTTTMHAHLPHQIYVPTNGKDGSLISFVDTEMNESRQFGQAVGDASESVDVDRARQNISSGKVPAFMQNQILLSGNDYGVFAFQQTTNFLQLYDHSGNLEWKVDLNIPATEGVFEEFVENNKMMAERGRGNLIMLQYGSHLEATESGVAVMLNTVEDIPLTVAWIPNDGSQISVVQFPSFDDTKPTLFSINQAENTIFFASRFTGEIFKADWPI
ncbi:MAG: 6-bladed beta-propeller [Balneolaceae bacterium]